MFLIYLNKKNIKKLFDTKTRNKNKKQNQTKNEKIVKKNSHNNETSKKIYV